MPLIGNKNVFAIEYRLQKHPFGDERGLLGASWGYIRFWVTGKDLFERIWYSSSGTPFYRWNLCYLFEWFCTNIGWILTEEPFPFPVEGSTAIELITKVFAIDVDYDSPENSDWNDKIYIWSQKHFINTASVGSYLPILYIRTHKGKIEISWDNTGAFKKKSFKFLHNSGVEYIDQKVFFDVIYGFLSHFINRFQEEYLDDLRFYSMDKLSDSLALIPEFSDKLKEKLV